MEETSNVKVLERGLIILETLSDGKPLGVNEIAKLCSLSPATTFRLLRTLCARGWVWQDGDEKYMAGVRMNYISAQRSFLSMLREIAYFRMAKLSESEHEAMNLVVRELDKCYILGQSRTGKIVDYVPPVGTVLPFHASACGKVLLSGLEPTKRDRILDGIDFRKMTESTITSREKFLKALEEVKAQGYALDRHESQEEGFCIAVPIYSPEGEIIAALSFSGFIGRRTVSEIDHYVGLLKTASKEISEELFGGKNG